MLFIVCSALLMYADSIHITCPYSFLTDVLSLDFLHITTSEIERMRRRSETNLRGYSARDKMAEAAEQEKVIDRAYYNLSCVPRAAILLFYVVLALVATCSDEIIHVLSSPAPRAVMQQAKHQEFDKNWTEDTRYVLFTQFVQHCAKLR